MNDVTAFIRTYLSSIWDFFTETTVPGLGFSVAAVSVGVFLAVLGLRLLGYLFGFSGSGFQSGDTPRTSSTRHPKISKERRHDAF